MDNGNTTLQHANRRLLELLQPGMSVLDAGCGTGAGTEDIADAVGERGLAVGIDKNPEYIEQASKRSAGRTNLQYTVGDLYELSAYRGQFDIAAASGTMQWLEHPRQAIASLIDTVRTGGRVIVLDYNHTKLDWTPAPPASMQKLYTAYLRWRSNAGFDNAIADHLPVMLLEAGLTDMTITVQHELAYRTDSDFEQRLGSWLAVISSYGHQIVREGGLSEGDWLLAEQEYRSWVSTEARLQVMYRLTVEGRKVT